MKKDSKLPVRDPENLIPTDTNIQSIECISEEIIPEEESKKGSILDLLTEDDFKSIDDSPGDLWKRK